MRMKRSCVRCFILDTFEHLFELLLLFRVHKCIWHSHRFILLGGVSTIPHIILCTCYLLATRCMSSCLWVRDLQTHKYAHTHTHTLSNMHIVHKDKYKSLKWGDILIRTHTIAYVDGSEREPTWPSSIEVISDWRERWIRGRREGFPREASTFDPNDWIQFPYILNV